MQKRPRIVLLVVGLAILLGLTLGLVRTSRQVTALRAYVLDSPAFPASTEVQTLRAQLEIMRQYDQRLLETVYWALGGITTLAALLLGFGWFANFRVYERDKITLQQDLRSGVNESLAEIRKSLDQATLDMRKLITADVIKAVDQSVAKTKTELIDRIGNVESDLRAIQVERLLAEARRWEKGPVVPVPKNALSTYVRAADIARKDIVLYYTELPDILDHILRLINAGIPVDTSLIMDLKPMLDGLPPAFGDTVKKIRALLGIIP